MTDNTESKSKNFFQSNKMLIGIVIAIVMLAWPPLVNNNYYNHVAIVALTNIMAILGYNLFFGYMGQVLFGPVAFFGIGAYTAALLISKASIPWYLSVTLAPVAAAIVAAIFMVPLLRLRGHTLALGTFGLAWYMWLVIERWSEFTGGTNGIHVPPPTLFDIDLRNGIGFYYIVLVLTVLVFLLIRWIMSTRHGRAIKAIRADEQGAAAMGVNVVGYKRAVFVVTCAILGLAGGLISQQAGQLAPDYAAVPQNLLMILMVLTGGVRSNAGMVIGGTLLSLLPLLMSRLQDWTVVIYSIILILIIRFLPQGIMGWILKIMKRPQIE
jgi:branched-chain amino acid transport system permease protein